MLTHLKIDIAILISMTAELMPGNPELYSMIDDPQENFNVAGELAYAEVRDK